MKLPKPYSLSEICEIVNCEYIGAPDHKITGINEIHMVENGDIVFVDHPKYYDKALQSAATTIIINKEVEPLHGKALIISEEPFHVFNKLTLHFSPKQAWDTNRDQKIDPSAQIAPGVVMGHNVSIGAGTVIHPNVVLYDNVTIGENVEIHSNTTLGSHAFYYKKENDNYTKMHSCGSVIIENNVEMIMVAHILYPEIDDYYPGSMSSHIIQELLRDQMSYEGVVVSDDMTMGAITENYSLEDASINFLNAGGDVLLICHGSENSKLVFESIEKAVEDNIIKESEIDRKLYRILNLKDKYNLMDDLIADFNLDLLNESTKEFLNKVLENE